MAFAALVKRIVKFHDGTVGTHSLKVLSVPHPVPEEQKRLTMEEAKRFAEESGKQITTSFQWQLGRMTPGGVEATGLSLMAMLEAIGVASISHNIQVFEVEKSAATLVQAPPSRLVIAH